MAVTGADWLQAQNSVLGSALIEPSLVPKVVAETSEADYSGPCRTIYNAMRKLMLSGSAVDIVSIASELGDSYKSYLAQLMQITPTAANLDAYIRICREQSKVLAVRDIAVQLSTAESTDDIRKLLESANGLMVDRNALRIVTMEDALKSFMARHTEKKIYLTWPVADLNDRIYAELGDFAIIAGYPSAGKSAWALQCAWHWAREYKVGFFSLETSSEKLFDRQMAAIANINMRDVKCSNFTSDDWDRICGMSPDIVRRNLELIPAAGMSPADIRAVTMMRGYQIIIVDYLQLLSGSGRTRTELVTGISIALHTLAQSMGVAVIALSQLRRNDGTDDPDMSDLRESGQIEQDADLIQMLYLKDKNAPEGPRVLKIAKNKEGTCPNILMDFDGNHQIFTKAQNSKAAAGKYLADGKRARRNTKPTVQMQMEELPNDYQMPF